MSTHDWVFVLSVATCLAWAGGLALGFCFGRRFEQNQGYKN